MNYSLLSYLNNDIMSLLDSLPLIESEYTISNPSSIPLLESKEFANNYIAYYSDLETLAEEYDITIDESIELLTKVHPISKNNIIVAIEESRLYYDTDILYRFFNEYVLIPEYNTPAYNLCDYCMTNFLESHDPFWIDLYITYPEITLSIQEAVIGKENKPGYLENMLSEINKRMAETKKSIDNPLMIDKQKKHLTNLMTQLDRQAMEIEDKIKERDGLQAARRQEKQNLQDKSTSSGGNSEMEAMKGMSTDAKKMIYKKNQEIRKLQNDSGNAPTPPTNQPDTSNQPQSWLSKKWSAFKNWWNNAGNPNGDNRSGGGGWFSNLVGKIKSGLGIQAQQTNPTSNTTPQSTPNTTPQTSSTTPVSNTPAKPAQPTPQQNATDANKQKAQQTQQAVSNYNAVKQAVTNQQQANSIKK